MKIERQIKEKTEPNWIAALTEEDKDYYKNWLRNECPYPKVREFLKNKDQAAATKVL